MNKKSEKADQKAIDEVQAILLHRVRVDPLRKNNNGIRI